MTRFWKIAAALVLASPACLPLAANAKIGSCDEPILFGTTISETGPFSTLTSGWRKMTEAFEQEVNKSGGIMMKSCNKRVPVKWVIYDDQSSPATAASLFEKMATVDKVDFFVGLDWSALGGPVPPIAEKHKIPLIASNVGTPSLYDRGLKYFWGTSFPTVPKWSERYFEMIGKMNPKPASMFIITHDNPVMKGVSEYWSKQAEAKGIKVVGRETFSQDLKDFTALVTKVRAARPDVVYIASFDNPSVPLIQQLRQLKVKAMSVHHTMLSGSLYKQAGKDVEGMTGELSWYPGIKGPYSDFAETVLAKSGVNTFESVWTIGRLASYLVAIQALEKAGAVDREQVRQALYKGTFKSPAGDIVFDERGFSDNSAFTIQIQDGKVQVVWPPEAATGKVRWPSPGWQ